MRSHTNLSYILGLAGAVAAATHVVKVGNDLRTLEGLRYSPDVTTAAVGDTVDFHFWPGKHDVVQGDYDSPCNPLKDGFYSGFITPAGSSGEADKIFTIKINNTDPIWIYCSETAHCQNGMVAVINPPSSGDSLDGYVSGSAKTKKSTAPPTVQGGVISNNPDSDSSSTPTSSPDLSHTPSSSSPTAPTITNGAPAILSKSTGLSLISIGFTVAICWAGLV